MKIRIVVPGTYNDQSLKARMCKAGDVLETRDWYGQELLKLGNAEEIVVEELVPSVEELKADEKPKEGKKSTGSSRNRKPQPKNVFLG